VWYIASFVVFVGCVKLLTSTGNPLLTAGVFTVCKVGLALLLGGFFTILITGAVVGVLSFGYFWLLNRVEGSGVWWLVLIGGVLLLA
jgi:hypothetical protein